jgi:hypothetical protein
MAIPNTRANLISYCKRKLGDGAVKINITDQQAEDRTDDALALYQEYHYDAIEKTIIVHKLTQTDLDNKWVPFSDLVIGVERILPLSTGSSGEVLFDARFHLAWDALRSAGATASRMQSYTATMENLQMIDSVLNSLPVLRYRRHTDRMYLDTNWAELAVDDYLVFLVYQILDPEVYTQVYGDRFLREYLTELIREQWGTNLSKYEGVQLPGGITYNGRQMVDDARQRMRELEEELKNTYEEPPSMYVG